MRIDVDHPFPGCQVLLNNAPVPFVHMADDIAGIVQHWVGTPGHADFRLAEQRGWVTILPPKRSDAMPLPFITAPRWHQEN